VKNKTLILGLGTGRCGTSFLFDLINAQEGIFCTNERINWGWYYNGEITKKLSPLKEWEESGKNKICDVGSYTLPHVRRLAEIYPEVRLIFIRRNRQATITSWLNWTNVFHNYWVPHKLEIWKDDPYDFLFPKFISLERFPKSIAIGSYYDLYYEECSRLALSYQHIWIETESLDEIKTKEKILDFCGFEKNKWNLDVECRRNAGNYN